MKLNQFLSAAAVSLGMVIPSMGATLISGNLGDTTLTEAGSPYLVTDNLILTGSSTLTIDAGVILKFYDAKGLSTGSFASIRVNGTAAKPVVFTSIYDDSAGGDDNKDGSASAPTAGVWACLSVTNNSSAHINHAIFRYGGNSGSGLGLLYFDVAETSVVETTLFEKSVNNGVHINDCGGKITFRNVEQRKAAEAGFKIHGNDSTIFRNCLIHDNGRYGFYLGEGGSDYTSPQLGDTAIAGSGGNRVYANTTDNIYAYLNAATVVKARKNFWAPLGISLQDTALIHGQITNYYASKVEFFPTADPDLNAPASIQTLSAVAGGGPGTLALSWKAPDEDSGATAGRRVKSYLVKYDTAAITNIDSARFTVPGPLPSLPGVTENLILSNLAASTTYYVAVAGIDEYGNRGPASITSGATSSAPATGTSVTTVISGVVNWTAAGSPYLLNYYTAEIAVGATLTIDPGVVVKMNNPSNLVVRGSLIAKGTAAQPIIFTSPNTADGPGTNNGLLVYPTAPACTLINCILEKGGENNGPAISIYGGAAQSVYIDSCLIQNGKTTGLWMDTVRNAVVKNTTFKNLNSAAINLSMATRANFSNIKAEGCVYNGYFIYPANSGGTTRNWGSKVRWLDSSLTYYFEQGHNFNVMANDTLEVGPGVTLEFVPSTSQSYFTIDGLLLSQGTAARPIRWTTKIPGSGFNFSDAWGYIQLKNTSVPSRFVHTILEKARPYGGKGILWCIGSSPVIDSCEIRESSQYAVSLEAGARPTIQHTQFINNWAVIYVGNSGNLQSDPVVGGNVSLGNRYDGIEMEKNQMQNFVFDADNIPYHIYNSDLTIASGRTVTAQGGARILFEDGPSMAFQMNGNLQATGTSALPVIFSSFSGAAGSWGGLRFNIGSNSRLKYCDVIGAGGQAGWPAIFINQAIVKIDSSEITRSPETAVLVRGNATNKSNVAVRATRFDSVKMGIMVEDTNSRDTLQYNVFKAYSDVAIEYQASVVPVLAGNMDSSGGTSSFMSITGGDDATEARYGRDTLLVAAGMRLRLNLKGGKDLRIAAGKRMIVQPGGEVQVLSTQYDSHIDVYGTLNAVGTANNPATFRSADSIRWGGINLFGDSTLSDSSKLDYALIRDGGSYYSGTWGMLNIHTDKAQVKRSTFSNTQHYGLVVKDTVYPVIDALYFDSTFDTTTMAAVLDMGAYQYTASDSIPLKITNTFWGDSSGPYDTSLAGGFYAYGSSFPQADDTLNIANFGRGGAVGRWIDYSTFVRVDKVGPRVDSIVFSNQTIGASGQLTFAAYVSDKLTGLSKVTDALFSLDSTLDTSNGLSFDISRAITGDSAVVAFTKTLNIHQLKNPLTDSNFVVGQDDLVVYVFGRDARGHWGAMETGSLPLVWAKDTSEPRMTLTTFPADSIPFADSAKGNPDSFTVFVTFDDSTGHSSDQRSRLYSYNIQAQYPYQSGFIWYYSYVANLSSGNDNAFTNRPPSQYRKYTYTFKLSADTSSYGLEKDSTGRYGYRIVTQVQDSAGYYSYGSGYDTFFVYVGEKIDYVDTSVQGPELIYRVVPQIVTGNNPLVARVTYSTISTSGFPITQAEYFLDSLGSQGTGNTLTAVDGSADSVLETFQSSIQIDTAGPSLSTHRLFFAAADSAGNWSGMDTISFLVIDSVQSMDTATIQTGAKDTVDFGGVHLVLSDTAKMYAPDNPLVEVSTMDITVMALPPTNDFGTLDSGIVKLGPIYAFEPSGAAFKGLQLAIPYDTAKVRASNVKVSQILVLVFNNGKWEIVSRVYKPVPNPSEQLIYNLVEHFSFYRLAADTEPPQVTHLAPSSVYTFGTPVALQADFHDNIFLDPTSSSTLCYFRQGGQGAWAPVPFSTSGTDFQGAPYSRFAFSANLGSQSGVQYRFIASDFLGNRDTSRIYSMQAFHAGSTIAPDLIQNKYRIISIPFAMTSNLVKDVLYGSIFAGNGGSSANYDPTRFRIFRYEGKTGSTPDQFYTEMVDRNAESFVRGAGYLAITSQNFYHGNNLSLGDGDLTAGVLDEPFGIRLDSGWTLIGNPFNYKVPLSWMYLKSSPTGLLGGLNWYRLNSAADAFDTLAVNASLDSLSGYFVYNPGGLDTLWIPPSAEFGPGGTGKAVADSMAQYDWTVSLKLSDADSAAAPLRMFAVGARSRAAAAWDVFDRVAPPPFLETRTATIPRLTWGRGKGRYVADFVPQYPVGNAWRIDVASHNGGRGITLRLSDLINLPDSFKVALLVRDRGIAVDLSRDSVFSDKLDAGSAKKTYDLLIGTQAYIERCAAGAFERPEYALAQNAPNPFNPVTHIKYALKNDARVNLSIYNAAGRLVRTLINDHQYYGRYTVAWNGKDAAGRTVATGVYFYRLRTPKFVKTRKMMMVK